MLHLRSFAKVNLYLDIGKRMDNGYHLVETILQTVGLYDEITIQTSDHSMIRIECDNKEIPVGENSLVYQAAATMMENRKEGLSISIRKNIPVSSGLGGGSSNVATILAGICKLLQLKISLSELMTIAANFGMDIPFFLYGGTVYAKGRGEILFPLKPINPPLHFVLINPGIKISTRWAYQTFDQESKNNGFKKPSLDIQRIIKQKHSIQLKDIKKIIYNRFDKTISQKYSLIMEIKERLKNEGALATALSGSGPTVYGIFENKIRSDEVYRKLKDQYFFVYHTTTISTGQVL